MRKLNSFFWAFITLSILSITACQNKDKVYEFEIETPQGTMRGFLYNDTPQHRDNFIKLAKEGFYDGTLFHRCIPDFMIQGGDPDSKTAAPGQMLGQGDMGYTIPAEFGKIHKKGALSAARLGDQVNPERASSGSQFFIVQGMQGLNQEILDYMSGQNGINYTAEQIDLYLKIGGRPDLDMNYSVFGEVTEGLDIIDKIASQPKDRNDRPNNDIPMKIRILN